MGRFAGAILLALAALLMGRPLGAQEKPPKDQGAKVDRVRVDAAIEKGIAYLCQAPQVKSVELVLLTFLHSGVRENDPDVQRMVKTMLEGKLSTTYRTALQAMALEELDR